MRGAAALAIVVLLVSAPLALGLAPRQPEAVAEFRPVDLPRGAAVLPSASPEPTPAPVIRDAIQPPPGPDVRPAVPRVDAAAKAEAKATPRPAVAAVGGNGGISGKASWFCRAGVSSCHYQYPDTGGADLYAAACGKLRRAMGKGWRNDVVTVTSDYGSVRVRLVDWCGSEDKTIDLYYDAFRVVRSPGNDGVARVRVTW